MSEKNRGNSIVTHPFREWYNEQILKDIPLVHIYSKQSEKIPPHLQVSRKTIAEYRNNILKINTETVKLYKEELQKYEDEEIHQEIIQEPEIKTAIADKAAMLIDTDTSFLDMHANLKSQIVKLAGIDDPTIREQIGIAETIGTLCDQMRLLTMDFLKVQGQLKESPQTQINIVTIEKNNAEIEAFKSAISEILNKLDPSLVPEFFSLLKEKTDPVTKTFEMKQQNLLRNDSLDENDARRVVKGFMDTADKINKKD